MFWKKKEMVTIPTEAGPMAAPAEVSPPAAKAATPKPKEKKLSPRETIIKQIEQLAAEQTLIYQLRESWGAAVTDEAAVIELNPKYPGKGQHKYILSTENLVDGKLSGERTHLSDSNKPEDLAAWILNRKGVPFVGV